VARFIRLDLAPELQSAPDHNRAEWRKISPARSTHRRKRSDARYRGRPDNLPRYYGSLAGSISLASDYLTERAL
jgi:hypothetical protein